MALRGKTYYDNSVCIHPQHRKFDIIFLFNDSNKSRRFYESFDHERKRMFLIRFIIMLCRHKNMYDLDVESKSHHYTYCPDCKMALLIDDETEEDKKRKNEEFSLMLDKDEIVRLESEISKLSSKLSRRENLLSEMKAELASKLEEHDRKYKDNY